MRDPMRNCLASTSTDPAAHRRPRWLWWLLIALYVALIAVWSHLWLRHGGSDALVWLGLLGFMIVTQGLFVLIPARCDYLMPTRPRRLVIPALIAALMITVLIGSFVLAMAELFNVDGGGTTLAAVFWSTVGLLWVAWTILFYAYARRMDRFRWMRRMVVAVLGGSVLQMLATVPSHIVVSRRPGCFVGMATMLGILSGLYVMAWAFGPGLILLFMSETLKATPGHCPGCGYNLHGLSELRCPECGRAFTFGEVRQSPDELGFIGK